MPGMIPARDEQSIPSRPLRVRAVPAILAGMTVHQLPVVHSCDVAIAGGGAGAVALALALRRRGLRVLVAAPRPYLGEDVVGAIRLWCDPAAVGDGLAATLFGDGGRAPTPLHAKRALEQALVAADIPLLLSVQAAGLVRDDAGRVAGLVLADRAGMQVVRAAAVVDGGERGLLADAAGCARAAWSTPVRVRRALVGPVAPAVPGATTTRLGTLAVPDHAGGVGEVPG